MITIGDLCSKANSDVYFLVYNQDGEEIASGNSEELSGLINFDFAIDDFWINDDQYVCIHAYII